MPHSRLVFPTLLCMSVLLAACGGSELTVQVLTEGPEGELVPVKDLEVEFLPYDRDSIFETLAAAAAEPEPRVPANLEVALDSVAGLQETWRVVRTQWAEVRDSLREISDRLRGMDQRSREYRQLFDQFGDMERRVNRLDRARKDAFESFTALQGMTQMGLDSLRAVRESWEDVAFEDYAEIVDEIVRQTGKEAVYDTTDVNGLLHTRLGGGGWYAHTRVALPAGELYWNVPTSAVEGDTLRLTPANGTVRMRS